MLVQTLSITTPPIVQDFDWPALVQQVQREKGSEQVSIVDVGGGMPHLSVPSLLRIAATISCGSTPDRSWDCASLAVGEHSFIGGERDSVRPGIGDREGPDQVDAVLARLPASLRYTLPHLLLSHFDRKTRGSLLFCLSAINRNATDLSRGWMWSQ